MALPSPKVHKQHKIFSLRARFISLALLLSSLVIIGTIASYFHSKKISDEAFAQLSSVSEQSVLVQKIHTDIIDAHRYLNLFLLSIDQAVNKNQYSLNINTALENLKQLKKYSEQKNIDYSKAIIQLNTLIHDLDNEVKAIHNSAYRHTDSVIMYDKIIPLMNQLLFHLEMLDQTLKSQDVNVFTHLSNVTRNQNMVLGSILLFFIFYILATLITIERMVFKPIAAIAGALKSKDISDYNKLNKYAKTTETRVLVDAFGTMQQQVVSRQKDLEYQALHDELTDLPNRVMLKDRLSYHLSLYKRKKNKLALFILDLNKFKEVNDTLGHHIGDQLLIKVGERFTQLLRENDTIARLGGDEFAILLPDTNAVQAINIAEKINESIESAFSIKDYELQIGVSIGIAIYPRDGEDLHTLMQHADVAMYVAKRNNRNYSHYNPEEDENSIDRLSLVTDLRKALKNNDLELYFQPKIALENNKISGAEALLRWNHKNFGQINSEYIIELAEQVGLINDLTEWIVEQAISYCSHCHESGFNINISINLSAQNIRNQKMCMTVKNCLKKYNLDSKHIILEITESAMMFNPVRSLEVLNAFSAMDVSLSIDDFGTGFSSLAYLKKFPVNELKIDKSFIMEIETDISNDVIVNSTIKLGHNLGLHIVAEGIENIDIYNHLQKLGCDIAQGYLISKPLDKQSFSNWLKQHFDKSIKDNSLSIA